MVKKITILALHLGYGGIERAIASLSNSLIEDYEIEIISTYKLYDKPVMDFNSKIKITYLIESNLAKRVEEYKILLKQFHLIKLVKILYHDYKFNIIRLINDTYKSIKTVINKKKKMINYIKDCSSDIIISTRDIYNLWLSKYGNKESLKLGWEHNHHNDDGKYIKKIVTSVQGLDYLVLVSKELTEFYQEQLKNSTCKCVYIPNSIDEIPENTSPLKNKNIISVGRLSKEKGYLDLIDVYKIVTEHFPDWTLNIIGDGVERKAIEEKIKQLDLEEKVILHGYQKRDYINEVLKKSSLYVMGSYTESFGIVLLEAFSYGIPAIAFTSARGANEIISNNWDGYLVENRDKVKMAKKICEVIGNYNRRFIMGNNASKKAEKFKTENIKEIWTNILEKR